MLSTLIKLVCLIILSTSLCQAETDYIIDKAYFEDTTGSMAYETVKQQTFQHYDGIFSGGYTASAYWIRLKIKNPDNHPAAERAILRILPSQLDEITLYDEHGSDWKPKTIGDRYPWSDNDYKSVNFNFVINQPEDSRYLYLRLKTTSSNFLIVSLINQDRCATLDAIQNIYYGIYIGALIIIFIIVLGYLAIEKSKIIIVFSIKQLAAIIAMSSYAGYYKVLFEDTLAAPLQDTITSAFLISYCLLTACFYYTFYKQYPTKKWATTYLKAIVYSYVLILFIWLFFNIRYALQLNIIGIAVCSIIMLLIPIAGIHWQNINQKKILKTILIIIQGTSLVTVLATSMPAIGLLGNTALAPYIVLFHAGISSFMLLVVLQFKSKIKADEKLIALTKAQALADSEQKQRIEQGKFISILAHEFKTPLSVLRLAVDSRQLSEKLTQFSDNAINNMNKLIERCVLIDNLTGHHVLTVNRTVVIDTLLKNEIKKFIEPQRISYCTDTDISIETDPILLHIILSNLLENALKYGAANEPIALTATIGLFNHQRTVVIAVKNKLSDIGAPDPDKLFQKFYRSASTGNKSGTGLGLFLSKSLAITLNGDLQYLPEDDYVSFVIRIPA